MVVDGRFETATAKTKAYKMPMMTKAATPTIAPMMAHFFALSAASHLVLRRWHESALTAES